MNFTEIDKNIPTLGIKSSQHGNKVFPTWE